MENKKQIFYRGYLKSCNYSCEYCPFSKHISQKELEKDFVKLDKFVKFMESNPLNAGAVMITPYGEALIHEYYWRAMAALSKISEIDAVGCQTNLSFPVKRMLEIFEQAGGIKQKLRLWCTFHPSMVSLARFLEQCNLLEQERILYCAGSVGVPQNIELLKKLRDGLSNQVYFWINPMDGLKRPYTQEEIDDFSKIDMFFPYLLKHKKSQPQNCKGCLGESLFVSSNGDITPCNISRKKLGNIYELSDNTNKSESTDDENVEIGKCGQRECSCFLSYSNRIDYHELLLYGDYPAFRIPKIPEAVFLDVDGTIVKNGHNSVDSKIAEEIKYWSKHTRFYLATSLPYTHAMKKCGNIKAHLSGGVFANGGMICLFEEKKQQIIALETEVVNVVLDRLKAFSLKIREYKQKGQVYKITAIGEQSADAFKELQNTVSKQKNANECQIIFEEASIILEDEYLQITARMANKLSGVQGICEYYGYSKDKVMAFGDSENDRAMMEYFGCLSKENYKK